MKDSHSADHTNLTNCKKIQKIGILLIKLVFFWFKNDIVKEKINLRFWYILTFAGGILLCFFCNENYRIIYMLVITLLILLTFIANLIFFNHSSNKCIIITKFFLMLLLGFVVAFSCCLRTKNDEFTSPEYNITFEGKIESIKLTSHETILILQATKSPNTQLYNGKIRIKYEPYLLSSSTKQLNNGDIVRIKSSLIPIKYSNFPNDDGYSNYAKFFNIIATGKAKSLEVLQRPDDDNEKYFFQKFNQIQNYRNSIQQRIYNVNEHSAGAGIVIAVLTGNNQFIPKEQLQNIRHSGCAHILAISGLHMSIVVAFVFMIFIHIFALIPKIALRYNTKKLAVLPAVITCLYYLNIANVPISATRSFLMVLIASITLLLNRSRASLNALFTAFFVMLFIAPNYLLSPSFQMSFMAVFGLTAIYNNNFIAESILFSSGKTRVKYLLGILFSSIIATISTVFFEIYHFKQYAWIGLISNIPVIPITEFLVLPFGFVGMIFNGTMFGDLCYIISGFFANIICIITDWTANLPYSFLLTKQMSNSQLGIIIFGIITLFLSRAKILKIIGLILFVSGFIAYLTQPKFVLVYNQNFSNIVFFENGCYYSVRPIKSEFLQSVWSQNLGVKQILPMDGKNKNIVCNGERKLGNMRCEYAINNKEINIYQGKNNNTIGIKMHKGKFLFTQTKFS